MWLPVWGLPVCPTPGLCLDQLNSSAPSLQVEEAEPPTSPGFTQRSQGLRMGTGSSRAGGGCSHHLGPSTPGLEEGAGPVQGLLGPCGL